MESTSSKSGFAAFFASWSNIVFFPLEKVKYHMTVSSPYSKNYIPYYKNSFEAFKSLSSQGIKQLYRGWHFQIISSISWSVYFFIYEYMKSISRKYNIVKHTEFEKFSIAALSSFMSNFLLNPITVIKTRALLIRNSDNWVADTIDSTVKTWKLEGIKGFWRGYWIGNLLGLNGAFTVYFYELFKSILNADNDYRKISLAGGLSKLAASSMIFPINLIKIRIQQEQHIDNILIKAKNIDKAKANSNILYYGLKDCISDVWNTSGFRGFYRGLGITLVRVIPSQALFFTVYEFILHNLA